MWANAQRDGRPAEHRWRSVQRRSLADAHYCMPCSNAAKTRKPLKVAGVSLTPEKISAASGSKFTMLWGHVKGILLLNKFFPIVDTYLSCEDRARQSCGMVPRWRFFCVLSFQRATCSTFQTCILNSHYGHTMCGSMVDIQSPTADIRRGKKEETG